MTACKDSLSGKKAVSATLAGVLAVGMVPAAAFAATDAQADTTDEQGIELQASSPSEAFAKATVTVVDAKGKAVALNKSGAAELTQKGTAANYIVADTIAVKDEAVSIDDVNQNYQKYSKTNSKWETVDADAITSQADQYRLVITGKTGTKYANCTKTVEFTLVAAQTASKVTGVCEGKDASDTEFVYTGAPANMSAIYNNEVVEAVPESTTEEDGATATFASFQYRKASGSTAFTGSTAPTEAGDYVVKATVSTYTAANGKWEKTTDLDSNEFNVTIGKLDLSRATVSIDDIQAKSDASVTENVIVNGKSYTGATVALPAGTDLSKPGAKKATVSIAASANTVASSVDVTFNAVGTPIDSASFKYNGDAFSDLAKIDLSKTKFDTEKVAIDGYDADDNEDLYDSLVYTVKKADGTDGTLADLATPGTYKVTVAVDSASLDYAQGGSATATVKVINGEVSENSVYVFQDGAVTNAPEATYDGTDKLAGITTKVYVNEGKKTEKQLVEGTDYEVVVKNSDNEVVTEAVNAGEYTIEIKGKTLELDDSVTLTVNKLEISNALQTRFATTTIAKGEDPFVAYTGEAVVPVLQVNTNTTGDATKDNWIDAPEGSYKLTYKAFDSKGAADDVKEVKDKGYYEVTIAKDGTFSDDNYDIKGFKAVTQAWTKTGAPSAANLWVADGTKFTDVLPADWYYDYVNKANDNGYVYGIGGTTTFAPNASIIRGDVVVIMYRMAGGTTANEGQTTDDKGYTTTFTDVDPHAYYAQAIQWAAKAGIVSGYGDGTFAPEQNISREEFACMLAKYAKSQGKFVASDGSDLAALPDAGSVHDWAKENVAWAVEQGLMGSAGYVAPLANITRAEAAKMCVVYQPEKTSTDFDPAK